MPLSMLQPIRTDDIALIVSLKPKKVFLLCGLGEDDLVVKSEGTDLSDRRPLSNSIMKAVDPNARVKGLNLPELQAIKTFVDSYMDYVENLHLPMPSVRELKELFAFPDLMNPACWTKMEKLKLRDLDSTLKIPNDDDRDCALEKFARALSRNGGLGKLGEIVAADAFIGNTDRFEPFGEVAAYKGPFTGQAYKYNIPLNSVRNVGNVFVALNADGRMAPSAADYLDITPGSFETFKALAKAEADDRKWPGRAMLSKESRQEYAEKIAGDLSRLLNPSGRRRLLPILGFNAASQIQAGMVSGARKIYTKMSEKFKNKLMPEGLRERLVLYADVF